MKRRAPRQLKHALDAFALDAAPAGILARAQRLWPDIAGPVMAAETQPTAEREGVLTVRCESATWANELELLGPDIRARLNAALAPDGEVRELRFTVAGRSARGRTRHDS